MKIKKNITLLFTSLFSIYFIFIGAVQSQGIDNLSKLKWLDNANPVQDAEKAISDGDLRLRAIYGYSLIVPGIERDEYDEYEKKHGFNPIAGTSDSLETSEHARLQHIASEYCLKYNNVILKAAFK
jgi:hypothetical protein